MQVLLKYTEYNEPHESLTNKNIIDVSCAHDDYDEDAKNKKANIVCEGKATEFIGSEKTIIERERKN